MLRSFPCICSGKHLPQVKEGMLAEIEKIKIGDITDFRNLMGAVIDASAFKTNKEYIDYAKHPRMQKLSAADTMIPRDISYIRP